MPSLIKEIQNFTHKTTRPKGARPNRTSPICFCGGPPGTVVIAQPGNTLSGRRGLISFPKPIQIQFAR
jgi:hypothetical protein